MDRFGVSATVLKMSKNEKKLLSFFCGVRDECIGIKFLRIKNHFN